MTGRGSRIVFLALSICALPGLLPQLASAQATTVAAVTLVDLPGAPTTTTAEDVPATGSVGGQVRDSNGALVVGAKVELSGKISPLAREMISGPDGTFRFDSLAPGGFTVTVNSTGLATWVVSGTLHSGEALEVPRIAMAVSAAFANVTVQATSEEIASAQISLEEKQRVLGVFPNFYATYIGNASPLTSKQKFKLAWRSSTDPVSFAVTGIVAGVEQSQNAFSGYGQGAQGYGKRFGAVYADGFISTFLGGAILPSLFHQDPRYFYKGSGSIKSRAGYAIAMVVVCKGDNGKWQPNYSNVLGNLATGGISNLYYPASDRNGAGLTVQNAAIGTASGAIGNLIQEFLIRKITPHIPDYGPSKH